MKHIDKIEPGNDVFYWYARSNEFLQLPSCGRSVGRESSVIHLSRQEPWQWCTLSPRSALENDMNN